MNLQRWLFEAQIPVGGSVLILREVLGNIFGLAGIFGLTNIFGLVRALGGLRRRVLAIFNEAVSNMAASDLVVRA
jgi:hypothetical protein